MRVAILASRVYTARTHGLPGRAWEQMWRPQLRPVLPMRSLGSLSL